MSFHPEDSDKLRRAFSALAEDCDPHEVDNERIWRAVRGELSQEERHAVIEEMADNPAMAEAWRIAQALHEELSGEMPLDLPAEPEDPQVSAQAPAKVTPFRQPVEPQVVAAARRPSRYWVQGLAAAAATVVLAIGIGRSPWTTSGVDPIYRVAEDPQIANLMGSDGVLPKDDFTLRWSALDGARYELRLLGPDLGVVAEAKDLDVASFRVDAERLAAIPSGTQLFWQIDAHLPDGRKLTSPTFLVRVQ